MIGQPYERSLLVMLNRDTIILNVKNSFFKHPTGTIDSNIGWHLWPIFVLIIAVQCKSYWEMFSFAITSLLCLQKGMLAVFSGMKADQRQSKLRFYWGRVIDGSSEEDLSLWSIRIQRLLRENANIEGDEFDVSHSWLVPHRIDFWALPQRLWHASYLLM